MNQVNIIVFSGRAADLSVNRGPGLYTYEVYSIEITSDVAGSPKLNKLSLWIS